MVTMPPARRFTTAEAYRRRHPAPGPHPAEWVISPAHWHREDFPLFVPSTSDVDTEHATPAYVNEGRWVARCPFCPGAQLVHPDDRRMFCVDCLCETTGFRWVPVVWPDDFRVVEAVLAGRPTAVCSWQPHETVQQIAAENRLMGWN